jgi:AcrR family transcriptional regulator
MTVVNKTGRRAANKEDKRRRLKAAAWELFQSQGFQETTTKDIARRAGVGSGTLFLYASDKADLLFLVLHDRLEVAVDEGLRSVDHDAPLLDQLMHVYSGFFSVYREAPDIARHFVKELPGANGPNAARVNGLTLSLLGQLGALIEAAQRRGEVRADAQPHLFANITFSLYFYALLSWLGGFVPFEGALPVLRQLLDQAFRGVSTLTIK